MKFADGKTIDVVGVGNALMDILVEVDDSFLTEHNLTKGAMHLVSEEEAERYLESIKERDTREVPGGASANSVRGVAALGGKTAFYGSIGKSMYGGMYRDALVSQGVDAKLYENDLLTGNAITYITPDHERTFTVHLGAAADLSVDAIDEATIAAAKVVHLEAFQFEAGTRPVLEHVIKIAKKHDTLVSLDLNDASLIERNSELFHEIVKRDIDIVFANESESEAFTGELDEAKAVTMFATHVPIAVVKCGEKGSFIAVNGEVHTIDAVKTNVVDTTGAGDLYAAGFLYGFTHGWDTEKSGRLGALLASEVIARVGVDIADINISEMLEPLTD